MGVSMSYRRPDRRSNVGAGSGAGFSLLEAIVAILILSIALTALYGAFGSAQTGLAQIEHHVSARVLARSILEEHTASRRPPERTLTGRDGELNWVLTVREAGEEIIPTATAGGWTLYEFIVEVSWAPRHRTQLRTLHLARPRPAQ